MLRPVPVTASPALAGKRQPTDALATVARGGLANLVGATVSAAANFALTLVVARCVSPTAAGVFFAVTSLFLMAATLGRLGTDTAAVYFLARWRTTRQLARIRPGLRAALLPVAAVGAVLAVAAMALAPQLAHLVGDTDGRSVGLIRALAVLVPVVACYDVLLGATRGLGWMRPTVLVEKVGRPLAQLALVGAVLAAGHGRLIGYAWALPYLACAAAACWLLRGALRDRLGPAGDTDGIDGTGQLAASPTATPTVTRELWRFTAPRAVAGVAQVVLQRLDIVLVAAMLGTTEAAIYTAATRFLVVGQFINQAISAPVQPELSAALAAHDQERARTVYRASTGWLVLTSWPVFGLTAALAPTYLGLFGHSYHTGTTTVVILSAAMVVASGVGLVDSVIIMAGRSTWNLWTTLLAVLVNVVADVALIPHLHLAGAALGWLASILAANLVPLAISWRRLGLHPFGRDTFGAYALAGTCWLALPGLSWLCSGGNRAAVAVALAIAAIAYAAGLWRWRDPLGLAAMLPRGRGTAKAARA